MDRRNLMTPFVDFVVRMCDNYCSPYGGGTVNAGISSQIATRHKAMIEFAC